MRPILALHATLMLFAASNFSIVTFFRDGSWQWCTYQYTFRNGFGANFASDYSLPVVLTYLAGFAVGIIGFGIAWQRGLKVAGILGVVLSIIGLISFTVEGSHWMIDHHRSWIIISPLAMIVLAFITCRPDRIAVPTEAKPVSAS